jgi:ribosomal protein S18 acetylase RimI-like enzyme
MLIRPLRAGDRAAWDRLWSAYLDFYAQDLAPEVTDATWRRLVNPEQDLHGLGALDPAGELLGFVHYLFHPVTWSTGDRCYLEDLFVAEAARGRGAGRRLIEAVYAAADARGADQVYWFTQASNTTARELYDRVGHLTPFVKYSR